MVTTESDDSVTLLCLPTAAIAKQVTAINLPSPLFLRVYTCVHIKGIFYGDTRISLGLHVFGSKF